MISRRGFITAAGGSMVLLATGCRQANSSAVVPAASSSPTNTSPAVTTSPATSPVTTSPVTTSPRSAPWSGADFSEFDRFLEETNTNAFRIQEGGGLVHEWYRTDETFARDIASAQKSVLSLLVGRAIADGSITLDTAIDDVLGPTWTPHGRTAAVTVRHLLTMTSGLDDRFDVLAEPGSVWHYSGAFAALFDVLTSITGRDLNDLADDWLFEPSGATTAQFYERRTTQFAPIGLLARASDLTAIGQLVLDASQPAVSDSWLEESFTSGSPMNESYGYLWWVNGQASFRLPGSDRARPGELIAGAPADLVAALGKDDQKLYVSRELDLTVARLGGKATPDVRPALSGFDAMLWQQLLQLRAA